MRLTDAQLARWRAFAAERGVSVADMVRVAVEHAIELMPRTYMTPEQLEHERRVERDLEAIHAATRVGRSGGEP